jgi:pyruvate/2-oxoglutarate/acetoin dehydrogenase E1 component
MREITFKQAITEAVDEEMARDPTVFLMGEDIGKAWGAALGEYQGLFDKYGPERIRGTPISETAILGGAMGAAITGMRPIAFLFFDDFLGVCGDELITHLTKMRYMFGGKIKMPVTITAYSGAGLSAADSHSKNLLGWLMAIPGLKVVTPSNAYDCKGLLKTSIRDDNPVAFLYHKVLITTGPTSQIPDEEYTIPLGEADIKREGSDVTVVAIALMVQRALAAADKLQKKGISLEVIDPRSLVPLDKQAIINSVKKTGKLVIMDEEPKIASAAAEISAMVAEEAFDFLDAPIKRVCAPDTPIPFSAVLEKYWMPDEENLIQAVTEIM